MKKIDLFWKIIVLLMLLGCNKTIYWKDAADISLTKYEQSLVDTALFMDCKIISLETNDNSLISSIDRLCVDDDTLFVFDKNLKEILIFDINGRYINKIHDVGEGPTEYMHLMDMEIDIRRRRILLSCDKPQKIMFYTYSGEFVNEFTVPDYLNGIAADGDYIYGYKYAADGSIEIPIYDSNMSLIKTEKLDFGKKIEAEKQGTVFLFGKGTLITRNSDVYFTRQFDNSIYSIGIDGIHKKYNLDFREHNLPESLLESSVQPMDFMKTCMDEEYVCLVSDVVDNDSVLFFKTDLGTFFYNKKIHELVGCVYVYNTSLGCEIFDFLPTSLNNKIVGIVQSDWVKKRIEYRMKKSTDWIIKHPELYELYETITDESNPILFFYEF